MKSKNEFTGEETERFWKFIEGDDLDFYEQNLLNQPEEVQRHFLNSIRIFYRNIILIHYRKMGLICCRMRF